jgi:nucleoside phosphorylase
VAAAVHDGQVSVELADQSRDEFSRVVNRTVLADALHQAGRRKESAIAFREAETILAEWRPQYPRLHSVGGHRLCDLLLAMAEPVDGSQLDEILDKPDYSLRYQEACEEVQGRATYALKLSEEFTGHGMGLLDIALDQLSLGRALLGLALVSAREFTEAREHLNRAVEGLRHSGYEDQLPRGLLARAAFRRLRAAHSGEGVFATDADAALADLREAEEIARRGHMRLHEVDVHLEWTRLSLQTDDNENARRHLDQAHELVTATGYRRRKRELAYLTGLWRRSEERRPAVLVAASLESERIAGLQPPIDFVIITALEEEREALLRQLPSPRRLPPSEDDIRVYFGAQLPVTFSDGSSGAYSVIVLNLLNMGRVEAATATGDAIRRWRPRYVLLVGIAGGVAGQDVALGDVLISDQVVDYELQKITEDGPKVRYSVHRADPRLVGSAQNYRPTDWHERVAAFRPTEGRPRRVIGPIATGDKIVAVGEVLARYRNHWPKLIGVEMEAGGAASACFQAGRAPGFFMVRAASDLADAEKDTAGTRRWRTYACEVAAAYAIALLQSGPVVLGGSR